MAELFQGSPGYYGYFAPVTGNNVGINFSKAGGTSAFFLVDAYTLQWQRMVQNRYSLNLDKPVAMLGYGSGQLSVQGMIGKQADFAAMFGGAEDICDPLTCDIYGGVSGVNCEDGSSMKAAEFTLEGLIPASINITGRVEANGVIIQQATAVFSLSGVRIHE